LLDQIAQEVLGKSEMLVGEFDASEAPSLARLLFGVLIGGGRREFWDLVELDNFLVLRSEKMSECLCTGIVVPELDEVLWRRSTLGC
jgi:hypothetical protein